MKNSCDYSVLFELLAGCSSLVEFEAVARWLGMFDFSFDLPARRVFYTAVPVSENNRYGVSANSPLLVGYPVCMSCLDFTLFERTGKLHIQASDSNEACLLESEHGRNMLTTLLAGFSVKKSAVHRALSDLSAQYARGATVDFSGVRQVIATLVEDVTSKQPMHAMYTGPQGIKCPFEPYTDRKSEVLMTPLELHDFVESLAGTTSSIEDVYAKLADAGITSTLNRMSDTIEIQLPSKRHALRLALRKSLTVTTVSAKSGRVPEDCTALDVTNGDSGKYYLCQELARLMRAKI